jgi:hypothetical protein
MGGGGGEIINHIVAHLNLTITTDALITGLLTNCIWEILKSAYKWHRHYKRSDREINPSINIYIYTEMEERYSINFRIKSPPKKTRVESKIKKICEPGGD